MADLTPKPAVGRQIIQAYAAGRFRIAGVDHAGSVVVLRDRSLAWSVSSADEIAIETLAEVIKPGAGAACRTFNVLVAEERRVAAALIALS